MIELSEGEGFCFDCHSQVPCFNECCRDLNQFLTPYDILRLKNHLNLTSACFLERYTETHTGPQTGLPVITLKPADRVTRICPFVTPDGCLVYADRPSSCRMYPLIRVLSRSRADGRTQVRFALLREKHCHGFAQDCGVTVRDWMEGQGLSVYNEMNDLMMDIISLKNQYMPGKLSREAFHVFFTMSYDLDRLRELGGTIGAEGLEGGAFGDLHVEKPEIDEIDDEGLLRFGMDYLKKYFRSFQPA